MFSLLRHRMARIFDLLARLGGDRGGAMAITVALLATTFLGVAALSLDVAQWYSARRAMQSAADAAAYGGAVEMLEGGTTAEITAAATTDGNLNLTGFASGATLSISVNATAQTVTASVSRTALQFLSKVVLASPPTIKVSAMAGVANTGAPVCLLLTSPTASPALSMSGSGTISASGCAVVDDSTSSDSLSLSGVENIYSKQLCGPGGFSISSNYGTLSPAPSACAAVSDPLADWPVPSTASGACNHNNYTTPGYGPTITLSPGVYCGGITTVGSTTLVLNPGIYILRNGGLSTSGATTISGRGVSLYLTGTNTTVSITASTNITLTAPTSGPMAGITMYQDGGAATGSITNTFSGSGLLTFTGVLYFGHQNLNFSGSQTENGSAAFTSIVANSITYSGSATLDLNSDYSGTSVPQPSGLALPVAALLQ